MGPHPGGERPPNYRIEAYHPNAAIPPLTEYQDMLDAALERAIDLMRSNEYTTISVHTPDALEVIRLWGQVEGWP